MNDKIIINPEYEFLKDYIVSIPLNEGKLGKVIYKARNTVYEDTVEYSDKNGDKKSITLVIKSFKIPPIYNRIAYTFFRKGKALASYLNAIELQEYGFRTPHPIASIRCYKHFLLSKSYYVCVKVEGKEIRFWEKLPNNDRLLRALAQLMVDLHKKGVYHRDFSPGNILFTENMDLNLLDINRMRFNVTSQATLMLNFQRLNESREETLRLARYYAEAKGCDIHEIEKEAANAYQRFHNLRHRKQAFKKFIRLFKK